MPARPTWKGYLKISLVNIPIKVFPATDAGATLSFNQLHGECQTRIQQKRWCPKCEREVPNTDIVKQGDRPDMSILRAPFGSHVCWLKVGPQFASVRQFVS